MATLLQFVAHLNPVHIYAVAFLWVYVYLARRGLLPPVETIRKFTSMLDDRGGNILVLGLLTSWFFVVTVKLFYHTIGMISNGQIKPDDAIMLDALNTVSGTFAGTCFGALLKTLTGSTTVPPPSSASLATTQSVSHPAPGTEVTATVTEKNVSAPKAADGA